MSSGKRKSARIECFFVNIEYTLNSYSIHVYGIKLGLNSLNSYLMAPELEFKMEIISIHGLARGRGGRGYCCPPPSEFIHRK